MCALQSSTVLCLLRAISSFFFFDRVDDAHAITILHVIIVVLVAIVIKYVLYVS